MIIVVTVAAIVLQFAAAYRALRLIPVTGRALAWRLIALALIGMGVRRCIALYGALHPGGELPEMVNEVVGLIISVLMFAGMDGLRTLLTTARQMERHVRRERDFSASILDVAGMLIVVLDAQGRIVGFNRRCEELTGYPFAEVRDQPLWDRFLLPEERAGVMATWGQLTAGSFPLEYENRWRTRDGATPLIAWSNTCLMDDAGQVEYVIATGLDVTEQRRTAENLQLNHERLLALLTLTLMAEAPLQEITDFAMEQGVQLTRSTIGYLAFLNEDESVLTMHSWSKTAMAHCAIQDKPIVYPVVTTGLWGEAVRQRKPVITNDYEAPSDLKRGYPAGHVPVKRHMNIPVFDGDRIVAVAGVGNKEEAYDDTDVLQLRLLMDGMWRLLQRKRAAEELQAAHDELEVRVQQRTAELARSNAALQEFAYVASHDLQEPLRKITAFGDRLKDTSRENLTADAQEYLERMLNAARRMQGLINDLLTYSRVTTKVQPFAPLDLNALVQEVMTDLEVAIEQAGATVEVGNLPDLEADALQMRQLFQNLLSNALKFRRPEIPPVVRVMGRLSDETWNGPLGEERNDATCVITVSDNGIGFDPRFADRIFGVFQRLHGREEYDGTGIGLAVCRKICERHGGTITAQGEPGTGSTFILRLPITPPLETGETAAEEKTASLA